MLCLKIEISSCKIVYFFGKVMIYVKKKKKFKMCIYYKCLLVSCKIYSSIYSGRVYLV